MPVSMSEERAHRVGNGHICIVSHEHFGNLLAVLLGCNVQRRIAVLGRVSLSTERSTVMALLTSAPVRVSDSHASLQLKSAAIPKGV